MKYSFKLHPYNIDGKQVWVGQSMRLKGCVSQGNTKQEAIDELEKNEIAWIETAKEVGIPIPEEL